MLPLVACSADGGMHVAARGRYVEIATERDEPVCGGTAAHMDAIIEAAFAVMGASPPDRRFVRFEWLELNEDDPLIGGGRTTFTESGVLIRSDAYLVEEHELVHAVQHEAWPLSNDFLHEGQAVLLDAKRLWRQPFMWPETADLDQVLGASNLPHDDYPLAWFVVSQIVLDHGFEGLRDLWHSVPRGSSAAEVRDAYEALFGRSMDALVENYVVDDPENPLGPQEVERRPCALALCPAIASRAWDDGVWSATAPLGCEDDPQAVGPDRREYIHSDGDVWRNEVLVPEPGRYSVTSSPRTGYGLTGCALDCSDGGQGAMTDGPFDTHTPPLYLWSGVGPVRVEVRAAIGDLPTDTPGTLRFVPEGG